MTRIIGYKLDPNTALRTEGVERAVHDILRKAEITEVDKVIVITLEHTNDPYLQRSREWLEIKVWFDFTPERDLVHMFKGLVHKMARSFVGGGGL